MIQKFYSKLSDKEKKIFYFAAAAVILALFDLLFLGPVTSRLKSIDEEIVQKENSLKRDLRLLSYQNRILAERETFSPYYSTETMTPDQVKASFLQKIEMLATEAKINLTKVAPSGEEAKKGFIKYFADLECTGNLEDIVKFMHAVDSTQDLLKIVKVNIISKQSAKEVSATMTVVKIIFDPRAVWTERELAQRARQKGQAGTSSGGATGQNVPGAASGSVTEQGSGTGPSGGGVGSGPSGSGAGADNGGPGGGNLGSNNAATAGSAGGGRLQGAGSGQDILIGPDSGTDQAAGPQGDRPLPASKETGRVKVSNIVDLWNQFWGIKPKETAAPQINEEDINWDEVEEDQNRKNLWEKLMDKPANE